MISVDDVKKLADLSRLSLSPEEAEKLRGEVEAIVAYIDIVRKVDIPDDADPSVYLDMQNVMRNDTDPHEPGMYTEAMLAQAPRREKDYLKVKKILG